MVTTTIDERLATLRTSVRAWVLTFLVSLQFVPQMVYADRSGMRVTSLVVNRVNIFTEAEVSENLAYRLLNRLHRTTRQETIVRALGVSIGDFLARDDLAALERNLRQLDLFASVKVQLIEHSDATATLMVNTRDLLSIVASADGAFVGGVGEFGVSIGERNLLGLGDSVALRLTRNTNNELRGVLSYRDLHWLGADKTALYRAGTTEEGEFFQLQFSRPFRSDTDNRSWSALIENVEHEIDYYEGGRSVAQVPEQRVTFGGTRWWRQQYGDSFNRYGLSVELGEYSYQTVSGSQAQWYPRPEDNSRLSLQMLIGRDARVSHRKVTGLDTLRYVQDLRLGRSAELEVGARLRLPDDGNATLRPAISGRIHNGVQVAEQTYTKLFADFSLEMVDNSPTTTTSFGLKLFYKRTPSVTHAMRLDYRHAENSSILPVQYTLGESNGLRGYANRLLSGDKMFRLNLESRINTSRRIGLLDLGLVGFFDAGWVSPETDRWKRSVGAGLRLGSNALLGRSVIRMDIAYPLDAEAAEPVFSAALGQVFTF